MSAEFEALLDEMAELPDKEVPREMNALIPNCPQIGHCEICQHGNMTCCECGDAMVPWHPDVEHLWKTNRFD